MKGKTLFLLAVLISFISGCVSTGQLDIMKNRLDTLEGQVHILGSEMNEIKKTTHNIKIKIFKSSYRISNNKNKIDYLSKSLAELEDEWNHDNERWYIWTATFRIGSAQLTEKHKKGLDKLAFMIDEGVIAVSKDVLGYASKIGSIKRNEELMMARATNTIKYLVELLGPNKEVPWQSGTLWKDYFVPQMGGITDKYGSFEYNQRVRFERIPDPLTATPTASTDPDDDLTVLEPDSAPNNDSNPDTNFDDTDTDATNTPDADDDANAPTPQS